VYVLVNAVQKIMGANEKRSPVMAWEENQKLLVASCAHNPHNTCPASCQHKTPRPAARGSDWAAVHVEFRQEAFVLAFRLILDKVAGEGGGDGGE